MMMNTGSGRCPFKTVRIAMPITSVPSQTSVPRTNDCGARASRSTIRLIRYPTKKRPSDAEHSEWGRISCVVLEPENRKQDDPDDVEEEPRHTMIIA